MNLHLLNCSRIVSSSVITHQSSHYPGMFTTFTFNHVFNKNYESTFNYGTFSFQYSTSCMMESLGTTFWTYSYVVIVQFSVSKVL
jgi:hypothetical protein